MRNKVPPHQIDEIGFPIIRTLRRYPEDPDGRMLFFDCMTDLADNNGVVRITMQTLEHYTRATPSKIIEVLNRLAKGRHKLITYLICGDTVVIKLLKFWPDQRMKSAEK